MSLSRGCILCLVLLAGCSTHPVADLCDAVRPGKLEKTTVQPYGGVAIPQGPIIPAGPNISVGPPAPIVPGAPVVPPPAALPGNRQPGVQLQGPGPDIPPLPPNPPR
jgi:hypothetical protein